MLGNKIGSRKRHDANLNCFWYYDEAKPEHIISIRKNLVHTQRLTKTLEHYLSNKISHFSVVYHTQSHLCFVLTNRKWVLFYPTSCFRNYVSRVVNKSLSCNVDRPTKTFGERCVHYIWDGHVQGRFRSVIYVISHCAGRSFVSVHHLRQLLSIVAMVQECRNQYAMLLHWTTILNLHFHCVTRIIFMLPSKLLILSHLRSEKAQQIVLA